MRMRHARSIATALLGAVAVLACSEAPTQQRNAGATDATLGQAVSDFLTQWLVQRDAASALSRHLALEIADERLVPVEAYRTAADHLRLQSRAGDTAFAMSRGSAIEMTAGALARWAGPAIEARPLSLAGRLAPIDAKSAPELWALLTEQGLEPSLLPGIEAVVYAVRHHEHYDWAAPATVGYRTIIPEKLAQGLRMQGVVSRIQTGREPWTLLMLWAVTPGIEEAWRLWAVIPVPSE